VTVQITQAQPVACPGHPFELKALGSPTGGTFSWSAADAELVDSQGAATSTGDRIFIRSHKPDDANGNVPAQSVSVRVTYTCKQGSASDTKTVSIHKIDFVVTNTDINCDKMWAIQTGKGVLLEGNPAAPKAPLWTEPRVQIQIDPSCPRKDDCAGNHRVGWLQTVRQNERVSRYNDSEHRWDFPIPQRDLIPPDGLPPFYQNLWVKRFNRDGDTQLAHHEDEPTWPTEPEPWADPRSGAPQTSRLLSMNFSNSYDAWLVVQNVEWSAHDPLGCFVFLSNFGWSFSLNVKIDLKKPQGSRCTPASSPVLLDPPGLQKGKGARSPILQTPPNLPDKRDAAPHLDG
jgi:hypothetical protein